MAELLLQPLNGRVLVEMPKDNSGVYIPQATSDSKQEGIVLEVANDVPAGLGVTTGARVRWERYAEGDGEFDYQGKQCVLIEFKRVTAVYKEGK